jgi:hypothetical protein
MGHTRILPAIQLGLEDQQGYYGARGIIGREFNLRV